jgi:hypothetical protein
MFHNIDKVRPRLFIFLFFVFCIAVSSARGPWHECHAVLVPVLVGHYDGQGADEESSTWTRRTTHDGTHQIHAKRLLIVRLASQSSCIKLAFISYCIAYHFDSAD